MAHAAWRKLLRLAGSQRMLVPFLVAHAARAGRRMLVAQCRGLQTHLQKPSNQVNIHN
jgi:hypothetical protein